MDEQDVLRWVLVEADLWVEPEVKEIRYIIDHVEEEQELGLEEFPALVWFDRYEMRVYPADIRDPSAVGDWAARMAKQANHDDDLEDDETSSEEEDSSEEDTDG